MSKLKEQLVKKLEKIKGLESGPTSEWIELRFYSKEDVDWIAGLMASFVKTPK